MVRRTKTRRSLLVSRHWIQAALLVAVFGFFVMGLLAFRTYTSHPPVPRLVVSDSGRELYTGSDVAQGQKIFLANGLMQYGSVLGHGGYLGPDYTADYLRRAATAALRAYGSSDQARQRIRREFRANRYDPRSGVLRFTGAQADAFAALTEHYRVYFGDPRTDKGLRPRAITDPRLVHQLTAFFSWTAWIASAERPGKDYSYTNNWPAEPLVGNGPTAGNVVWSVVSLIALLVGIGALFGAVGRWGTYLGWKGRQSEAISFRSPDQVRLTPAQRVTAFFFLVVALLFLAQVLLGGATEHYRADLSGFFGIDIARVLPFNLARTWHLQLSLFWVVAAFLAAGIFLAPLIAGREPRGQKALAWTLLSALSVVAAGSLTAEGLSIHGFIRPGNFWGSQQFEWLDLPRLWQILLVAGLLLWILMMWRVLRGSLSGESRGNMPWLFFLAGLAIPVMYAVGLLATPGDTFTVTDFWRFWVVHLWVEDFLELFTTVMVAYMFVQLGVVREKVALVVIYLDIILYSAGGVIGTMHHLYFSGEPAEHLALGAFFSALEVVPLTFLTVEAWSFLQLGARQHLESRTPFPHRWAVMFLVAVGFWNFLGAGVFGFLINLPIVSYYEIGTGLTANHAHGSMMGVYGMLAVALGLFALRYLIPAHRWPEKWAKVSFWCLNIGLAWMCFATLLPLGLLQLYESVASGYFEARSLAFVAGVRTNTVLEWLRLPGDLVFIIGGVLPFCWIAWLGVRHRGRQAPTDPVTGETPAPWLSEIREPVDTG
ncbi:cbb3-type cytochrome c oxidase subunit I [Planotetraspora sp. A-T 1434]|uniref:nitric-oxide reductase large subunit n=1 Tax=Planotetraspora sp. A-T 1434 TaxID=2979219 RepID=UPI0021C1964A|nr:cbb3-type cytochrome c oxidase subunit I [Planotetraspora sp. A-T 1434]MCT9933700.1 cbb3-type cytochrome c oxidase subunit I [Planotetraspora sp. A-T 1434]